MRHAISVVTAVRSADVALLARAHASLVQQDDVDWTWVVEVDGPADVAQVPPVVARDGRVEVRASGTTMGVSAARNLALARVRGEYVAVLDADDEYVAGALLAFCSLLAADASLAAVTAAFVCVDEGVPGDVLAPQIADGTYAPGDLPRQALRLEALPVKTQVVAYRTVALRAVGGWPGLPLCQDVAAFMSVAMRFPVHVSQAVVYRYHRWAGQTTDPGALSRHDLMLRSRIFLAQHLAAGLAPGAELLDVACVPMSPTF